MQFFFCILLQDLHFFGTYILFQILNRCNYFTQTQLLCTLMVSGNFDDDNDYSKAN